MKARKLTLLAADLSGYFCFLSGRNPGDRTQGPEEAEQALYHRATPWLVLLIDSNALKMKTSVQEKAS